MKTQTNAVATAAGGVGAKAASDGPARTGTMTVADDLAL